MAKEKYDFCGWATRHNVKCSDGRTITAQAFKDCDGKIVPLVWNHNHTDINTVLGKALLEHRDEGVYAYCSFNNTPDAQLAKEQVIHGDITNLSIYANQLKQSKTGEVFHGYIKELSLVLAGANPGAYIEDVIVHSDDADGEATIYNCAEIELCHSEENLENNKENNSNMENEELKHAENQEESKTPTEDDGKTIQDVVDSMTEEQKTAMYYLIGQAIEDADGKNANNNEEGANMKHNAFEEQENENKGEGLTLTHSDLKEIVKLGAECGSLKKAYNEYVNTKFGDELQHGITNIDNLFPSAKTLGVPATLNNDDSWVAKVMNAVHHTPFSRVKSQYFDITADEARAKGYVKGDQKVDEVIVALQRETTPQTVYKHQSLDRDDVVDITDFDVVAYLKAEMRTKLDEELARAFLVGDGRSVSDKYKIKTTNIRPILGDDAVYSVPKYLDYSASDDDETQAKKLIKLVKKSRKEYRGKGTPTFYTTEDVLTAMLCIEATDGRCIYETAEDVAKALRVKEIVTVTPMELATRTSDGYDYSCLGIMVNLDDYNVGADKGGEVNMFDDFDIDYNKQKYLIETRCSGALTTPKSALTFELKKAVSEAA